MKLSITQFDRAKDFIQEQARPVDCALFAYYFTGGSPQDVLAELAHYQNEDGGFGHGLEPDIRTPASSPIVTSVALQYAERVQTPADHLLVRKAMGYLEDTYQTDGDYWPATFLEVNDAPHAPWWSMEVVAAPAAENWANPSAELTGCLHRYAQLVPEWLLSRTTGKMEAVLAAEAFNPDFPFYTQICWEQAMHAMPAPLAAKIEAYLHNTYQQLHPLTPEKLSELSIYALVESPDSVVAQLYPDSVNQMLDQEIEKQAADGGWWPGWEWGMYADVWPTAKREWAGKLTLECMLVLRNFNKIEH